MSYILETGVSVVWWPNYGSVDSFVFEGLIRVSNESGKFLKVLRFQNMFHFNFYVKRFTQVIYITIGNFDSSF